MGLPKTAPVDGRSNVIEIADEQRPITVRGLFYRVMSRGLVPKTEKGYELVQREALKLLRSRRKRGS